MESIVFPVYNTAYCVWDWDLKAKNLEFINQIDGEYFGYLAAAHYGAIDADEETGRAALALRSAYHHGIETLLTLIGAAIQAPFCFPGWVLKAKTEHLRSVIEAISRSTPEIPNALVSPALTWDQVSEYMHRCVSWGSEKGDTKKKFAHFWHTLAHEWLQQANINEYNSIKHGLRAKQGGFQLAVGLQDDPGTPAPPERMRSLGGSEYGSRFFIAESIAGAPNVKPDPNFRLRRQSLNWNPMAMARALQLIAISINNIKSFALTANGVEPQAVQFSRPEEEATFDEPWANRPGVTASSFDTVVREADIQRSTRDDLKKLIEERMTKRGRSKSAAPNPSDS